MLIVDMSVWPHGNWEKRQLLGRVVIINDGTGTENEGNYVCSLIGGNEELLDKQEILTWDRNKPAWLLVKEAMRVLNLE